MTTNNKPGALFWVIAIVGLLWNAWGGWIYYLQATENETMMSQLPAEQIEFLGNIPSWSTAAFAVAVWMGLLGCLLIFIITKNTVSLNLSLTKKIGRLIKEQPMKSK